jgi:hypothetical protein
MGMLRVIFILMLLAPVPVVADVVELTTGERIEGKAAKAGDNEVTVEVGGKRLSFPRAQVRTLHFGTGQPSTPPASGSWVLWKRLWSPILPKSDMVWKTVALFNSQATCASEAKKIRDEVKAEPGEVVKPSEDKNGYAVSFEATDPRFSHSFQTACWPVGVTPQ